MKKSGFALLRLRCLLVGLAIMAASALAGGAGCILGPKQDDPDEVPSLYDTGVLGATDTSPAATPDGGAADAAPADSFDPGSFDGCGPADADGGDAMTDGACEVGADAAPDGDASDGDAPEGAIGEGGSDVATGG